MCGIMVGGEAGIAWAALFLIFIFFINIFDIGVFLYDESWWYGERLWHGVIKV